jgi:hypothetical protein
MRNLINDQAGRKPEEILYDFNAENINESTNKKADPMFKN